MDREEQTQKIEDRFADTTQPTPKEAEKRELEKSTEIADTAKYANSPNTEGKSDPNKPYQDPAKLVTRAQEGIAEPADGEPEPEEETEDEKPSLLSRAAHAVGLNK